MRSNRNILDIKRKSHGRVSERRATSAPISPRQPRLRTRKRRQRLLAACVCVLVGAGVVGGLGGVSHLERLAVQDVHVQGAKEIIPAEIAATVESGMQHNAFKLFSARNIFLYPKNAIEQSLSHNFPRIKTVSIGRETLLAQAVIVTLEERAPYATWCNKEAACFFMDATGFIFAPSDTEHAPETSYIFKGGLTHGDAVGQSFLRTRIDDVVALMELLKDAGYESAGITVENETDFTVHLIQGPDIYVPFSTSAESIVHNLVTALESESLIGKLETLTYIDLRFGNRVYFK